MITCIIPCYRSEETISLVVTELVAAFEERSATEYEIILVNDASPDNVMNVIKEICNNNKNVKAIDLAINLGQHNAIMAGIKHSKSGTLVFLDDDGQTPANEIWKLLDALDDDCDVVFAKYQDKRHSIWRNMGSRINDKMAESLIGKPKDLYISSYCACKGFVADELRKYDGKYPYLSGLLLRTAKRVKNIAVIHRERATGTSGYTMKKLFSLWLNGFTAFSITPLRIATFCGCTIAAFGFLYGIYIVLQRLLVPYTPIGFTSLMATLLLIGGMIMIMLGLIGEYIGRIYLSINKSPQFVVREKIGFEEIDSKE